MNLILAEHGIRKPGGIPLVGNLVAQMNTLIGATVQVAFLDVFDLILSKTHSAFSLPNKRMPTDRRSIVTSALLSQRMPRTHQHVRTNLPSHAGASGNPNVGVIPALVLRREIFTEASLPNIEINLSLR